MLYLRQPGPVQVTAPPPGVVLRTPLSADAEAIGRLHYVAYDPPADESEAEAIQEARATFAGAFGPLNPAGSRLAFAADELVGVVLVVDRAPWPDTPDCPFVIEMYTAPAWRRRGLASALLTECMAHAPTRYALNVLPDNTPALKLYGALGFHPG